MNSRRECHCPDYVSRCVHDSGLAIWFISTADGIREYEKRAEEAVGEACVGCGFRSQVTPGQRSLLVGGIYGPGLPKASPDCHCSVPMRARIGVLCYLPVQANDDLDKLWMLAVTNLTAAADEL